MKGRQRTAGAIQSAETSAASEKVLNPESSQKKVIFHYEVFSAALGASWSCNCFRETIGQRDALLE